MKKSNIFHRRLNYQYPLITRGKGIYLYDKTGKQYIDGTGGALVCNLGHGVKEIAQAVQRLAKIWNLMPKSCAPAPQKV